MNDTPKFTDLSNSHLNDNDHILFKQSIHGGMGDLIKKIWMSDSHTDM